MVQWWLEQLVPGWHLELQSCFSLRYLQRFEWQDFLQPHLRNPSPPVGDRTFTALRMVPAELWGKSLGSNNFSLQIRKELEANRPSRIPAFVDILNRSSLFPSRISPISPSLSQGPRSTLSIVNETLSPRLGVAKREVDLFNMLFAASDWRCSISILAFLIWFALLCATSEFSSW